MGEGSPQSFTRKECFILFRALLPEIALEDSEEKIREVITSVIRCNKQFNLSCFSESDFEFIDVNGKQASVPTCQESQQFNGRAVKQMAGTGAIYVRLLKKVPARSIAMVENSDSDFEPETASKPGITHVYISSSDSESSVDLPSFLHKLSSRPTPNADASSSAQRSVHATSLHSVAGSSLLPSASTSSSSLATSSSTQAHNVGVANSSGFAQAHNVGVSSSGSTQAHNVGVASSSCSSLVRNVGVDSSSGSSPARNVGVATSVLSRVPIAISSSSLQSDIGDSTLTISSTLLPADSALDSCISTSTISSNNIQPPSPSAQLELFSPFPELLPDLETGYRDIELPLRCRGQNLENLCREFPSFSMSDITVIYEVASFNYYSTRDFLSNITLDNLLQLLHSFFIYYNTEESPKIRISQSSTPTELTEVLLGFYKSSRFNKNACVKVAIEGNQVMDSGGVRRQLFDQAFEAIGKGYYGLFEGSINRLRPVVKPSNIASGLLKNVGRAVAHRLIMDHIGFPHLSPPLFYYLIGQEDIAMTLLRESDVSGQAEYVLAKLKSKASSDVLIDDPDDLQYVEVILDESGSDATMEPCNRDEIIQTILMHNGLLRRKAFLDCFAEGLEVYKIFTLMKIFPDLFLPVFTSKPLCSTDIINLIVPVECPATKEKNLELISALFDFISGLPLQGLERFLHMVTGTHHLTQDSILLDFTSRELDPAVTIHTCSKTIVLSTNIADTSELPRELSILMHESTFTMT